jgi:hypothetical protein
LLSGQYDLVDIIDNVSDNPPDQRLPYLAATAGVQSVRRPRLGGLWFMHYMGSIEPSAFQMKTVESAAKTHYALQNLAAVILIGYVQGVRDVYRLFRYLI